MSAITASAFEASVSIDAGKDLGEIKGLTGRVRVEPAKGERSLSVAEISLREQFGSSCKDGALPNRVRCFGRLPATHGVRTVEAWRVSSGTLKR